MSDRVECAVIGAGVVGLAIGRRLAQSGREVVVIERNAGIGEETSSRNSEVIHAGLYYPTASLKARLCVTGKAALYEYCERRRIPHRRCGKLIVAPEPSRLTTLQQIATQASSNGVADLEFLDQAELERREPGIEGTGALWSPGTGIVDSHALMHSLAAEFEAANGVIATLTEVEAMAVTAEAIRLRIRAGEEVSELLATTVINAAGLDAGRLADACTGQADYCAPPVCFAKGNYFTYHGEHPFQSLIYTLPVDGGLGIHATLDLEGQLRFGPDVEWIAEKTYVVDPGRRDNFAASIRSWWPGLEADMLRPGYAGIRPRLSGPGQAPADFRIDVTASGAARQLIHLLGIESPGLTSVLSLADRVVQRLETAVGRDGGA